MSSSRSGLPSRSITASIPCWRGSGPIAACSLAVRPSTTNSAKVPASPGTPSAAYRAPASDRADRTILPRTSRTDSWLETASTTWLTCSKISSWPASPAAAAGAWPIPLTVPARRAERIRPQVLGPWSQGRPAAGRCAGRPGCLASSAMRTSPVAVVTGASRGLGRALAGAPGRSGIQPRHRRARLPGAPGGGRRHPRPA